MPRPSDPNAKIDLLRAAEAVFVEHGLDRARVEDITDRAGRSKGSFYLHFESKEDAFRQIIEALLARLASFLEEQMQEPATRGGLREQLAEWLRKDVEVFEYLWQNRGLMRLVLEGGRSAGYDYLIDEFAERTRQSIVRTVARGVGDGLYRADLDVEMASLVVAGAYDRVARQLVRQTSKPDLVAWLRDVQTLVVRGMGSDAAAGATRTATSRKTDQRVKNLPPIVLMAPRPAGNRRRNLAPAKAVVSPRPAKTGARKKPAPRRS